MGVSYRFLATVEEGSTVLNWFRSLSEAVVESERPDGCVFYFRDFGPLDDDAKKSPVVNVFIPVRTRGVLTTIGEVHFLATPLSKFPGLNKISKKFRNWLEDNPCVFSRRADFVHEWDYFLEGSARNWDPDIFALPEGLAALRRGEYFIAHHDLCGRLDLVCRKLQLRDVRGIKPA